jgi:hypothetical protein
MTFHDQVKEAASLPLYLALAAHFPLSRFTAMSFE